MGAIKGVASKGQQMTWTPHDVSFANGKLKLVKPDFRSAAFFVKFGK